MASSPQPISIQMRLASRDDLPAIVDLVNRAFEVESFFLTHDRTHLDDVTQRFEKGEYLLAETPDGHLVGCVYFEKRDEHGYFGMLSVEPALKGSGIGRRLIGAVEDHARERRCAVMDLTVVNLRTELPPLYGHFGYEIVGTLPPPEAMRSRVPCHLILMSKALI